MLPSLLIFCDFLEHRLHTSNVSLLRRILSDFYAGNEHTLQDFMRLGANVVTVMPVERKGPRHVKEAKRLLTEQKEKNVQADNNQDTPSPQTEFCVFRYLSARVATKNILWLRDMFQEFCQGGDKMVREFVRRGNVPISVLPVDIQALCMAPLPPPPLMVETMLSAAPRSETETSATSSGVTPSPTLSPQRKRSRRSGPEQTEDVEEGIDASDGRTRKQTRRASQGNDAVADSREPVPKSLSVDEVRLSIINALQRIEAKEPWKKVFKLENAPIPFSRVRYPKLAARLQQFWETHAQAVWERKFWSPLSRSRTHEPHTQRRCRQSNSQTFFEKKVIIPVYTELGTTFFVDMDQRDVRHNGWYYNDQPVDLYTLARRYGLSTCLQYMESEAFKRFPVVPGASRNFNSSTNGISLSMWSSSTALKPILNAIIRVKAKRSY